MTKRLTTAELLQAGMWFQSHREEVATLIATEVVKRCHADTGVKITYERVTELAKIYGIERKPVIQYTGGQDRVKVVARELFAVMQNLGLTPSDDFMKIIRNNK
jgi:hypothetical protein